MLASILFGKVQKYATWADAENALDGFSSVKNHFIKNFNKILSKADTCFSSNPYITKVSQLNIPAVPEDQLSQFQTPVVEQPTLDQGDPYAGTTTRSNLENYYVTNNLSYGDRLRMVSPEGTLADIILMPDGTVAIQDITLRVEYGKTNKYTTWEEADKQVPGWAFNRAIFASVHDAVTRLLPKLNPYIKDTKNV